MFISYLSNNKLFFFSTDYRPHKCTKCEKSFKDKHQLKWHMKQVHKHEKHKCTICPCEFNNKLQLDLHLARHKQGIYEVFIVVVNLFFILNLYIYKYDLHKFTICPCELNIKLLLNLHLAHHKKRHWGFVQINLIPIYNYFYISISLKQHITGFYFQ